MFWLFGNFFWISFLNVEVVSWSSSLFEQVDKERCLGETLHLLNFWHVIHPDKHKIPQISVIILHALRILLFICSSA